MQPDDILSLYPVQICDFEEDGGIVTVRYVNTKPSFMDKYIFRKLAGKPAKIDLDEIGSYLWPFFDGKHSVEEITKIGENKFGEQIFPAEDRISRFIMQMAETRLIKLYQKEEHTD